MMGRTLAGTLALVFVAWVVHAAYREHTTCPVVGDCASIHLKLMQTTDWSRARPIEFEPSQINSRLVLASH